MALEFTKLAQKFPNSVSNPVASRNGIDNGMRVVDLYPKYRTFDMENAAAG
jgi:hypothetical protein